MLFEFIQFLQILRQLLPYLPLLPEKNAHQNAVLEPLIHSAEKNFIGQCSIMTWSSFDLICGCGLFFFSERTCKSLYLLGFHNNLMIGSSDRDWWFMLLLPKIDAYSGRAELWVNQCYDNIQFTKKKFLLYFLNRAFDKNTLCSKCCTGEFE